ncbi:hypothetical protein ACKI1I_06880 [Streptomyces turgidiscabies]|uniref:hypothetical protein n=1 Tax=Streptomyces TaxID=1883 RepID=UPI00073EA14F|nr:MULTISPECIES: hypothetical protein [Streptomyces]MDX3491541.1 hypothetical protein [Streptomyces turgidiscabies]
MSDGVFSSEVRRRAGEGVTYSQMEAVTREAGGKEATLTAAWWNKVALGESAPPPEPKGIPGVAGVLEIPEREVAVLVCKQWYGVSPDDFARDLFDRGVDSAVAWLRRSYASMRERQRSAASEAKS